MASSLPNNAVSDSSKRRSISIQEKIQAIEQLERGESVKLVAAWHGVAKKTVNNWKRIADSLRMRAVAQKPTTINQNADPPVLCEYETICRIVWIT